MARAKVLQVLEAAAGGTRTHVLQILRGLDSERYELHLACSFQRDPAGAEAFQAEASRHARVIEAPMKRRPAPLADLRALRALASLMRAERYDIVHTHAAKAGFLGRLAARRARVPAIIHTPHTFPFQRVDTRLAWLYRWLERRAARWCHRIVCLTESQRQIALEARLCEPEKLVVIPNGVALPPQEPEVLRRRYRAELGLDAGTPAVGFVGRLSPQKDIQTLLSVAAELFRSVPDVRVLLVGTSDNRRYLRSLRPRIAADGWRVVAEGAPPAGRVAWSPELPVELLGARADAAELVAAFDVLLLPSRYEGMPYALLEAMACRVPAVASDVTGNRDAMEHGMSGLLVPPGDAKGFCTALREVLCDSQKRRRLGGSARERVAERFTEGRFVREIDGLYSALLGERGG